MCPPPSCRAPGWHLRPGAVRAAASRPRGDSSRRRGLGAPRAAAGAPHAGRGPCACTPSPADPRQQRGRAATHGRRGGGFTPNPPNPAFPSWSFHACRSSYQVHEPRQGWEGVGGSQTDAPHPSSALTRVLASCCHPTARPPAPRRTGWNWGTRCAAGGVRRGTAGACPAGGAGLTPRLMTAPCRATSWGQKQQGERRGTERGFSLLTPPRAYQRGGLCSEASSTAWNEGSSGISSSCGSTEGPADSSCGTSPGIPRLGMKGLGG